MVCELSFSPFLMVLFCFFLTDCGPWVCDVTVISRKKGAQRSPVLKAMGRGLGSVLQEMGRSHPRHRCGRNVVKDV